MNADEVAIRVTGQNTSTPAMDSAKRGMKGLKDEAGETSVKVKVLGESVKSTTRATDDLGDKARKTTREMSALDRKILELRASTLALGKQFESTGDSSLLKKFRADSRELSGLERMRKQLGGLAGDVKDLGREAASTASTFTSLFQGGIINALKSPTGAAVAAPVVAGATINAGALAGGALTAGIGAGVAGAGVAGAAMQSKAIQDLWTAVTSRIKNQFLEATTSFEQPTIAAIRRLDDAVEGIHMNKIFSDASKFVEPLSVGAAKAVSAVGRGVEAIVSKGEPAIRATSDAVAEIGVGVGKALETIAGGSEGGAKAIRDLGSALSETVQDVGTFVRGTEEAYDALDNLRTKAAEVHPFIGAMYKLKGTDDPKVIARPLDFAADSAKRFGEAGQDSFRGIDQRAQDALNTIDRLNHAFDDAFGKVMGLDQATIRYQQSIDDLATGWEKSGRSLDANTQAGRDNLELIERIIQASRDQRDAAIAAGGGTQEAYDQANGAYLQQLKNLRAQLVALGANTAAVDALIAKYQQLAQPLTKHITVIIDEKRIGNVDIGGAVSGGDQRRNTGRGYASGGVVGAASGMVLSGLADVAERGREIALLAPGRAVLPPGSQIIPNGTTENMLARGGGGGAMRVELVVSGAADSGVGTLVERLIREGYITIRATSVIDA